MTWKEDDIECMKIYGRALKTLSKSWQDDDIECLAIYTKVIGYLMRVHFDDVGQGFHSIGRALKKAFPTHKEEDGSMIG